MKKIAILKKKEVVLGGLAIFFLIVGFMSYNPIFTNVKSKVSDIGNYPESALGEATLVSSNEVIEKEESDDEEMKDNDVENTAEKDYFLEAKMDRDNIYSKSLEVYENIMESSSIANDQKAIAQSEITNITNERKVIATAENLIKLRGFEDVVIFKNESGVSVILRSDVLQPEQVAQIQNIVEREFQVKGQNINITCK